MKKIFVCLFFVVAAISCTHDKLKCVCPERCWAVPGVTPGVTKDNRNHWWLKLDNKKDRVGTGVCKYGVPVCDNECNIIECNGEVLPSFEICDGKDNECLGTVDQDFFGYPLRKGGSDDPCNKLGECYDSQYVCLNGEFQCVYDESVEFGEEKKCNLKDENCDGLIDNINYSGQFCYPAPPELQYTANFPPCHAGMVSCVDGQETCVNYQLPQEEKCDPIDWNCNNNPWDVDELNANYDIVFLIDNSGSMCGEIEAVIAACDQYVYSNMENENLRFALVIMTNNSQPVVSIVSDFGNIQQLRDSLVALGCNGNGAEWSAESMNMICDSSNPLELSWRDEAARIGFVFSDEELQSYEYPYLDSQQIVDTCVDSGTILYIWGSIVDDFPFIANNTNGKYFGLSTIWEKIYDDMNSIILTFCM